MNNNAEKWLFAFSKVKWLLLTGQVEKSVRFSCQIFSGFNILKLLKSVNFWQSYSKNKKVDIFGDKGYICTYIVIFGTAGLQEEQPACKNWVMRCWCRYLSGARCRLFVYSLADATAIPQLHHLLPHLNPDWSYVSCTGLPRLSWKRGC